MGRVTERGALIIRVNAWELFDLNQNKAMQLTKLILSFFNEKRAAQV